jgi:hypothetical protein
VYVLGLLAGEFHRLDLRHEVCEHGAIEHAAVHDPHSGARDDDHESLWSPGESSGDAEHHHCSLATATCVVEFEHAPLLGDELAVQRFIATIDASAPRAPRIPRYLLAPHHSPPVG